VTRPTEPAASPKKPAAPDTPSEGAKKAPAQGTGSSGSSPHADWWRETIESIVVALILAFLFRTFEAEAFVIPTGSMAPTLLGRHKDVHCEQCGQQFTVGASEEVDINGFLIPRARVDAAVCPNCRYPVPTDQVFNSPVFTGDRILVNKFPYEFAPPKRWDVLVFKYPEEPKTNYIKRLIGLPGETIEIRQGDIYLRTPDGPRILRKDNPQKQREVQILVYDNDKPERALHEHGWPQRWAPMHKADKPGNIAGWSDEAGGWRPDGEKRTFEIDLANSADALRWFRYRHIVPNENDWRDLQNGRGLRSPRPQLITDFCGYNAYSSGRLTAADIAGVYWVGDLTLDCQVDVLELGADAQLVFELVEGARKYRCRILPETGEATLLYPDPLSRDPEAAEDVILSTATTPLKGTGSYRVTFANVDNRLLLWINDRVVDFGDGAMYQPHGGLPRQPTASDGSDLTPVGVAAHGLSARVSHLLLARDIYYRCEFWHPGNRNDGNEYTGQTVYEYGNHPEDAENLARLLTDPKAWYREYERGLSANKTGPNEDYAGLTFDFPLADDEYFVMGDNSPRSKDSRLWSNARNAEHRHAVPRSALVGKAFFIYWPHGVPFGNDGKGYPDGGDSVFNTSPIDRFFYHRLPPDQNHPAGAVAEPRYPVRRVPFYPNVERMERIR